MSFSCANIGTKLRYTESVILKVSVLDYSIYAKKTLLLVQRRIKIPVPLVKPLLPSLLPPSPHSEAT